METKNNSIIADTSALVSLIIPSDVNHAEAVKEATRLVSTDRLIILPSEVLAETINILGKKFGHEVAIQSGRKFLDFEDQFAVTLTDADELRFALHLLEKEKQSVSFTDCVVMAVAHQYNTKNIFGFDEQFEDAGYKRLRPTQQKVA